MDFDIPLLLHRCRRPFTGLIRHRATCERPLGSTAKSLTCGRIAASLLALAIVVGTPRGAVAGSGEDLSTQDFLAMPELFQLSVVTGSMAILNLWGDASADGSTACYARFTVPEDIAAIIALHADREPEHRDRRFAETLVAVLKERCERS